MEHLEVMPHEGIGPLKLGMSKDEMFFALKQLHIKWTDRQEIDISEATDTDCYTRYQENSSFSHSSAKITQPRQLAGLLLFKNKSD